MHKIICLVLLFFIFPSVLKADVIYNPYNRFGLASSWEFIGSYEYSFTKLNTVNFWGGIGAVSMTKNSFNPSIGYEIAVEFRQYFKNNNFRNFNLGLYAGFAGMKNLSISHGRIYGEDITYGIVPGAKLTYKIRIKSIMVAEPYISLSNPWYNNQLKNLFDRNVDGNNGLYLTLGIRIGLNKVRTRHPSGNL